MPIKGILTILLLAVVAAFVYRKPLSRWIEEICDESIADNAEHKDKKETYK